MRQIPHPFTSDSPLLLLNTNPTKWFVQTEYPGRFSAQRRAMTPKDILEVLEGRLWIATYAPSDGITDRVEFDLDSKSREGAVDRDGRYWAIRELMGFQRRPLVVRTPSGWGLHVSYRIPRAPLVQLVTGLSTGVVADILQDAGLSAERGSVEIYPQERQAKRLPVGRSMAILDPDSLEPIVEAPEAPTPASPEWRDFADAIREWHARPYEDLPRELVARAPGVRPRPAEASSSVMESSSRHPTDAVRSASRQLIDEGLPGPSTRYEAEFSVGAAIWRDPALFAEFGACVPPTRECVASALARWLSARHNGFSQEWLAEFRGRSVEQAVDRWRRRYLQSHAETGDAPVDRMHRAALAESDDCGVVSPHDMAAIRQLADDLFGPGRQRYAFEVWANSLLRATKSIAAHHAAVGGRGTPSGDGWVEVEILADWMEGWPWGGGRSGGARAYTDFRDKLLAKGWLVPVSRPVWHVQGPEGPGDATRYRVRTPLAVRASELPLPLEVVARRIRGISVSGRGLTLEEAYHALDAVRSVRHLARRYGEATAARLRSYVAVLRPRLDAVA